MKILILGAGGMLGHQIAKTLHSRFPKSVYGMIRKPKSHYEKYGFLPQERFFDGIDVLETEALLRLLDEVRPQWIVNCVGITLRKSESKNFSKCMEINAVLPHRLALWARHNEAKVIHFGTDCVFDGKKGSSYKDFDQPTATDLYGTSKYLGEITDPFSLTLRLSIVGRELDSNSELVEWFLQQKGKTIKGFSQTIYSGLSTPTVAKEVARIIQDHPQLSGLYQVASEPISKYDLLQLLNEHFANNTTIEREDQHISNKSLDFERYAAKTGFRPPSWSEMIKELAEQDSLL